MPDKCHGLQLQGATDNGNDQGSNAPLDTRVPAPSWDGDSLGGGTSMWELKSVKKGGFGGGDEREVKDGWGALGEGVRWTDLEILHNFPSGLNKKGARGKAEMSIFAFFCAQRRQHRPPLRGGRLR